MIHLFPVLYHLSTAYTVRKHIFYSVWLGDAQDIVGCCICFVETENKKQPLILNVCILSQF